MPQSAVIDTYSIVQVHAKISHRNKLPRGSFCLSRPPNLPLRRRNSGQAGQTPEVNARGRYRFSVSGRAKKLVSIVALKPVAGLELGCLFGRRILQHRAGGEVAHHGGVLVWGSRGYVYHEAANNA